MTLIGHSLKKNAKVTTRPNKRIKNKWIIFNRAAIDSLPKCSNIFDSYFHHCLQYHVQLLKHCKGKDSFANNY